MQKRQGLLKVLAFLHFRDFSYSPFFIADSSFIAGPDVVFPQAVTLCRQMDTVPGHV